MLKNKKVILCIILAVLLCLVTFTVNAKEKSTTELKIEGADTVEIGKSINLKAKLEYYADSGIEMSEEQSTGVLTTVEVTNKCDWVKNNELVTVKSGVVTGVKEGTVTITAQYEKYTAIKVITVVKATEEITDENPNDLTQEAAKDDLTSEENKDVVKNLVEKIEILKEPQKVKYSVGEKFDYSGMEVSVTCKIKDLSSESGYDYTTIIVGDKEFEDWFKVDLIGELKVENKAVKIISLDNAEISAEQAITVEEAAKEEVKEDAKDGRASGSLPYAGGTVALILASALVIASGVYIFKRRNDLKEI